VDLSAVPDPAGLLVVGRVNNPNAILKTVGTWAHRTLPNSGSLVDSLTDDTLGAAVDLSRPIEAAVTLSGNGHDPKPLAAVSVAVRSFDDAKDKLGAHHRLVPRPGGQFFVGGIGKSEPTDHDGANEDEDEKDDAVGCVLAPAVKDTRLVCGKKPALDALVPYLTRTLPRKSWPSDVHVEVFADPVREPLKAAQIGVVARSIAHASTPALRDLVDASVGELTDFVNDANRMTFDAQIAEPAATGTLRVEYGQTTSWMAKFAASQRDHVGSPPPAFWRLPAEADMASFWHGADPSLFDRPRELLGNAFIDVTNDSGLPLAERKAVRDLVGRMFSLYGGATVYGKGLDAAAVDKTIAARKAGENDAERAFIAQLLGWYLLQVHEPIAKVGPILKDTVALWNRPAFAKWAKKEWSSRPLVRLRIAPLAANVKLPKETVHLEITIPLTRLVDARAKKGALRPLVVHVIAVPDQGASWIGFSVDEKLLADRIASSLSSASGANTLAKVGALQSLRDTKINGAGFLTLRGLLQSWALSDSNVFRMLSTLPGRATVPITLTFTSEGPSPSAAAGTEVTIFDVPRGFIEDAIKAATSH